MPTRTHGTVYSVVKCRIKGVPEKLLSRVQCRPLRAPPYSSMDAAGTAGNAQNGAAGTGVPKENKNGTDGTGVPKENKRRASRSLERDAKKPSPDTDELRRRMTDMEAALKERDERIASLTGTIQELQTQHVRSIAKVII